MSKILIIEDDVFLGDVLVQKLQAAGYEPQLARDGLSGMEQIRAAHPDLILLDIILPHKNGYEILEEKAKDKSIARIPVIIISNSGQPVEINRALALGVKDYLVKADFDPEEVLEKVRLQLGGDAVPAEVAMLEAESAPPQGGGAERSALRGKTIVSVEDDTFLSDIIARKLGAAGCTFLHARDGETALRLIEEKRPALVLLDILLPGMDGFEVLRRIKADPRTASIPVFLFSNLGQQADIEKGKTLGAARFFVKAMVTLDEVLEEMKKALRTTKG